MRIYQGENPVGASGKSAYQVAVDGGYTGSEEDFQILLNGIPDAEKQAIWDGSITLTDGSTLQNTSGEDVSEQVGQALGLSNYLKTADVEDVVLADIYSKDETLSATTAAQFSEDVQNPDDAFAVIAGRLNTNIDDLAVLNTKVDLIMNDVASITVTLKDSAGTAIPGVLVQGILSDSGQAVYSNDSGVAAGYISEGSQVVKVTGYADIVDYSETLSVTKGTTITKTITLTTRNFLKITSSQSVKFSGNVETVDVTVVGGGGGGGLADSDDWEDTTGGGGGGGGYAIEQLGIQIQPETKYPLVVGAGGTGNGNAGGDGGTSSAFGYSAAGGKCGGTRAGGAVIGGSGGNGNGSGGTGGAHYRGVEPGTTNVYTMLQTLPTAGSAGTQYMYTSFTEKTLCGGGGGGGLCSDGTVASGGSPAGGAGGRGEAGSVIHAKAGNDYLGGGGGGGGSELEHDDDRTYIEAKNAKGGSGGIGIRMHLKSAA